MSSAWVGVLIPWKHESMTMGQRVPNQMDFAPAARKALTIRLALVPRTILSSTMKTFLPLTEMVSTRKSSMAASSRASWVSSMKIRPP